MSVACMVLGVAAVAYGLIMAILYPAGGFFLVWIVAGLPLIAAACVERIRLAVCVVYLVGLLAVGGMCGVVLSTAAATPPAELDYVVVLGAGLREDGYPSETLRFRLEAALAYLAENTETTCIVSGGQGFGEPCTEADAMAEYLMARGLDEGRIVREDRSTTTAENVRNSAELLAPGASVGIVTNNFHLYRALRIAEKNGMSGASGLAAPTNPLYLPHALLRECFAVVKDALVGNI